MEEMNIGIDEGKRKEIAGGLGKLLADTYTLYLKTHNYHWNVVGPRFRELHLMFEEQYQELAVAVDNIAERIRTIGGRAPGTYKEFSRLTSIEERDDIPVAKDMVKDLLHDNETVVRTAKSLTALTEGSGDDGTHAMIDGRIEIHEKTAWMLRSLLG